MKSNYSIYCDLCNELAQWEVWVKDSLQGHYCNEHWNFEKENYPICIAYDLRFGHEGNRETNP